jgi:hypothetical protein
VEQVCSTPPWPRICFSRDTNRQRGSKGVCVLKVLTAVLITLIALPALASDSYPIHIRERLKWELWSEGLPEFEDKSIIESKLPEDLEGLLEKLDL